MRKTKHIIRDIIGYCYYNTMKRFQNIGNRCLIYHAFGTRLKHDSYGISININKFKDQMKFLNDHYKMTDINDFTSDDVTISISIDDGYKDTNDAINILNNYNIPFTLFITAGKINQKGYLSDTDIYNISQIKNSIIGTHGMSHNKFEKMNYISQLKELKDSKLILQNIIKEEINITSYPHGSFDKNTTDILSKLGYKWAACSKKGFNSFSTDNFLLCRSEIIASDTIIDLTNKIKGYYDYY